MMHEPTTHSRELVRIHAIVGTTQLVIASLVGVDAKTLRLHYRAEARREHGARERYHRRRPIQ